MTTLAERRIDEAPLQPARPGEAPLDLREADLREGRFAGADLTDARLQHACLAGADLTGAVLRGANLRQADLALARLQGADLRNADLTGADLAGADLREARLDGADLTDAELGWARIDGAFGLPAALLTRRRADGRVEGAGLPGDLDEPAEGLRAFRRGQAAHDQGHLGLAERHYRTALGWVPDSDAVRHALGCVALERGDPAAAQAWWQQALAVHPRADRARIDLIWLALWRRASAEAVALLEPVAHEPDAAWARQALQALQADDPLAAASALRTAAGDSPGARWHDRQPAPQPPRPVRPEHDAATRLGDEAWVEAERQDLLAVLRQKDQPAWLWHSAIARAIAIGALDLAQRAEQRLSAVAPEQRLWGLELKQLDVTAQAFEALVRTRRGQLGAVRSVRWVAIGAHGPTARLDCEGGVFFAKRYLGTSRPAGSVAFTHRVCRHLHDQGLHVPVALGDRDGDDVMVFGDDLLALYPDLQGGSIRDTDLDPATAAAVGEQLGRVHRAGEGLGLGQGRPRGGIRAGTRVLRHPSPTGAWLTSLGQDAACAALFDRHPLASRLQSLLEATARRLRSVATGCPPGLVHGDFGAGNVLHRQAGGFAIVDWDLCDADLRVWDLARTIDLLAVHWPDEPGLPAEIRHDVARALVQGYEAARPLSRAERAALPVLVAASRIDLDAAVLPLCVRFEPDVAEPVLAREAVRLARAAAGAPEVAEAVS